MRIALRVTKRFTELILMIKYEDECVDCGKPCLGDSCPNRKVPHTYCDECGDEADELRELDGEQLCTACLCARFLLVEVTE